MLVAELFSVGRDRHWLWQRWNRGAIGKAADGEAIGEAVETSDSNRAVSKLSDGGGADSGAIGVAADGEAIGEAVESSDGSRRRGRRVERRLSSAS